MNKKAWALALTVGLLGSGSAAQAELLDAGNGLVNDTVLDICWVANASLSAAQLDGPATWDALVTWADELVYAGYDDWRLASLSVAADTTTGSTDTVVDCDTATKEDCRDNELGYMYTNYLPGDYGVDKTGNQTVGDVTLTGIRDVYWSGTENASNPDFAWRFGPFNGSQDSDRKGLRHYGWAVRPGQCRAAPEPIPVVGAWGLGLLGLLLMVLARARLR